MAYIGNQPTDNFVTFATQNFTTSATSSYTLSHAVSNENEIALFINNVRQHPGSGKAYTASGTALTLSANTASTDVMYCIFLGRAIQSTVPATNSITAAMVGNDLVSGKDALAATPADTDEFLVSDAGTLKRIDYSLIKSTSASDAFFAYDLGATTAGDLVFTTELFDDGGNYNTSNGRYTAPSAGKYLFLGMAYSNQDNTNNYMYFKKNGTAVGGGTNGFAFAYSTHFSTQISMVIDLAEDDYIHMTTSNTIYQINANFTGVKLY
jgi:hypothetical protein